MTTQKKGLVSEEFECNMLGGADWNPCVGASAFGTTLPVVLDKAARLRRCSIALAPAKLAFPVQFRTALSARGSQTGAPQCSNQRTSGPAPLRGRRREEGNVIPRIVLLPWVIGDLIYVPIEALSPWEC